jgi:hypothetical protein
MKAAYPAYPIPKSRRNRRRTRFIQRAPDTRFVADKPLSAYAEVVRTRGLIIT